MRRIGIITDAHANLPALEAALAALERAGCETILHTGDAIGIGPHPAECLEVLLGHSRTRLIMGNHDAWFAFGLPDPRPSWMSAGEWEHQRWVHAHLRPEWRAAVAAWPYAIDLAVGPVTVTFCHYARSGDRSGFAPIIPRPDAADLDRLFGSTADVVFYGHHHPTSDLTGRSRYVNPGALGCHTEPLARFAVLTVHDDGPWDVRLGGVPYDRERVLRDLDLRDVPARADIRRIFFGVS